MERGIELTDPRALRAYAHPTRMALVGLLRREGPLTATRASEVIGESVASCSYHLRQLAKFGLVEEVTGAGREKPWRATAKFTNWPGYSDDPAVADAARDLGVTIMQHYFTQGAAWLRGRSAEPREWQEAAEYGDTVVYLTAAELKALTARMDEVLAPLEGRSDDLATRPEGARPVHVIRLAFPLDAPK